MFLKFLDVHFTPEIDILGEAEKSMFSLENFPPREVDHTSPFIQEMEERIKEKKQDIEEKLTTPKSMNAERKDVVYKNLIRNLRKHLFNIFVAL